MNLQELVSRYKNLSLATLEDNQKILDFYDTKSINTSSYALRYDRKPDFFSKSALLAILFSSKMAE